MNEQIKINSKLPNVGTTIFTVMSGMALEHGAINLSQGFPNYEIDPVLKDLVDAYIKKGYNQYSPMPGVSILRQRIAEKIKKSYAVKIDPDHEVTVTNGATEAYTVLSQPLLIRVMK